MKLIDYYYKAFKDYRTETQKNKSCVHDRQAFIKSNESFDKLVVTKYLCKIEEDWISEIEKGLVFVENAVKAERQFIRTNGEVVPIEKVKKVSKDSVSHLAKHSDLITHMPKDSKDVIPDKLFMTEKLSDYAVYENRFLYKLLCYLRDFISLRYEKIHKLRSTYISDFEVVKKFDSKGRVFDYNLKFHDINYFNEYPIKDLSQDKILTRIENIEQIVLMLLNTPLMTEVSKSPMIKDPIVKTNVLKMNNDFKNALVLYEYIISYNKLGYEAIEVKKDYTPYSNLMADELAEIGALVSYLTNKFGNELSEELEDNYLIEERKRKELEHKELEQQIQRLHKKVKESGQSIDEYLLLLEKRNRQLVDDSQELKKAEENIVKLNDTIRTLNSNIESLNLNIKQLNDELVNKKEEIIQLNINHENEIKDIELKHLNHIEELKDEFESQIENVKEELNESFAEERNDLNKQIDDLNVLIEIKDSDHLNEVRNLNDKLEELDNSYISKLEESNSKYDLLAKKSEEDILNISNQLNKEIEEKNIAVASMDALRVKYGLLEANKDLTSEERFKELEEEYLTFNKFFKKQWKLTRKAIRRQIFFNKKEKKPKE